MRKIKEYRKKIGMTQKKLAEVCKVTEIMICFIETGRKNPSIYLLRDIAQALGVTMDDLME